MLDVEMAQALAEDAATLAVLHDAELSAATLAGLKQLNFPDNFGLLPVGEASLSSFDLMRAVVTALPDIADSPLLDDLAADFAAIYLTGAHGASPSESFWLSDDHLVCQEAMFDLRALYATAGLAAPDWRKRPDDHLVHQLDYLARRLAVATSHDDWRAIATFFDRHLLRWLPDFAARIAHCCDTLFYAALLTLTTSWCQQVRELIAEHLGEAIPAPEKIRAEAHPQVETLAAAVPAAFVPGCGAPSW